MLGFKHRALFFHLRWRWKITKKNLLWTFFSLSPKLWWYCLTSLVGLLLYVYNGILHWQQQQCRHFSLWWCSCLLFLGDLRPTPHSPLGCWPAPEVPIPLKHSARWVGQWQSLFHESWYPSSKAIVLGLLVWECWAGKGVLVLCVNTSGYFTFSH